MDFDNPFITVIAIVAFVLILVAHVGYLLKVGFLVSSFFFVR